MITTGNLQNQSKTELAAVAKRLGIQIAGLSKDQLVQAISRSTKNGKPNSAAKKTPTVATKTTAKAKPEVATKKSNKKVEKPVVAKAESAKVSSAKTATGVNKKKPPTTSKPVTPAKVSSPGKVSSPSKVSPAKVSSSKIAAVAVAPDKKSTTPAEKPSRIAAEKPKLAPTKAPTTLKAPTALKTPTAVKAPVPKPVLEKTAVAKATPTKPVPVKKAAEVVEKKKELVPATNPKVLKKIREMQLQKEATKDISFRQRMIKPPGATDPIFDKEPQKDRIAIFVRDPFWLHATWDITRGAIERSQAALAEQWYGAKPVLRLIRIEDSQATSVSETVQTEIEIRGGVRNWYIPWTGEPANFRVSVGYLGSNGRYHVIALSNIVHTPAAGSNEAIDQHWTDLGPEGERIFAMSGGYDSERETGELQEILEERLNRSLGAPTLARLGAAADAMYQRRGGFHFDMDVELVVYGSTSADAYLTLNEEPVALRPDGTFVVRLPFPDRRQVIPAVAVARDGSHQRTIVVGVERNTKIMEPMEQEQDLGE